MKKIKVSFQGEAGAFSEQACIAYFNNRCIPTARESFRDLFDDVVEGRSRYAVVPIENSLFGSVHQNYDLLQQYPLFVVGEIKLRIAMNLLALPSVKLTDIRHVYSHPQGLGQSDAFLRTLKRVTLHPYYDTAGSAKMISEEQRTDAAAIASASAASHYKLKILRANIETDHRNFTRFLVISRAPIAVKKGMKTSLIFAIKNTPGSLFKTLAVFALRNINLLKIESRPFVGKPWEYLFFVDIDGNPMDTDVTNAINHLQELTTYFKNLGSYPAGRIVR
ncbi:MAG TPA: prephenate dehydratase [Bacteroidota bacterium]|nr:prephenate dehydratase [Bacteroidota bacterium]